MISSLKTAIALLLCVSALSGAAPAAANTIAQLAEEAVTEQCPELLGYEGQLAQEPGIVSRGYAFVQTIEHPRAGTVDQVRRRFADGEIIISNARDTSFCQVASSGGDARAAFQHLRNNPALIPLALAFDAARIPASNTGERLQPLTLRTDPVDGQYLSVQFVDLSSNDAGDLFLIQQYILEE